MMDRNESTIEGNYNIVTQGNKNIVSVTNNIMIVDAEYSKNFKTEDFMVLEGKNIQDKTETNGHVSVPVEGAKVYLSINVLFETSYNRPTGKIEGLSLGVTVTNFNVTPRYFNQPVFKTSVPFDNNMDAFYLMNSIGTSITFPKRLEYGEVFTANYKLSTENINQFFVKIMEQDSNAVIKAVLHTTLGETFFSNECPFNKIVNVAKQMKMF